MSDKHSEMYRLLTILLTTRENGPMDEHPPWRLVAQRYATACRSYPCIVSTRGRKYAMNCSAS